MGKVVTYANNPKQCFCQMAFESGERILISIAGPPNASVKIMKLLFSLMPIETVWEFSAAMEGGFESYVHRLHKMFPKVEHPLDSIRDCLLACKSITEAKNTLNELQKKSSQ